MKTTTGLTYRPFTREELEVLPEGTIVAMRYNDGEEPEIFRVQPGGRGVPPWAVLTALPQDYEWERWTLDEVHSEFARYAVVYQPEAGL